MNRKEYAKRNHINKFTAKFPLVMLLIAAPVFIILFPIVWIISQWENFYKDFKSFINKDLKILIEYIKLDKG